MKSSEIEQRTNMKFCFKLGKTDTEAHEILVSVYGDAAVSRKVVYKWFERFRGGAESAEDKQRSGRPPTSTADKNMSKIDEIIRASRDSCKLGILQRSVRTPTKPYATKTAKKVEERICAAS
jgi:transposase